MRVIPLFSSETKTTITRSNAAAAAAAAFLSTQSFSNHHPITTFGSLENHFTHLIHASNTTQQLKQIHAQLYLNNLTQNSRIVTQLIPSYSSFKSINFALSTFHHFLDPNPFLFNALIRSLSENSQFENSICYLIHMLRLNVQPNQLTFPFVVKSAASLFVVGLGRCLHGDIIKFGLEFDSFVRVSLVDMYVKLGFLSYALQMFDETPERNKLGSILLWNVLINGCCRAGDLKKANELFETMPERNSGSWNSLINGFLKEGDKKKARLLFEQMPEKNVVSWTTMVAGFTQNGDHQQALDMFFRMLDVGVKPNDLTIVSALAACARIGALAAGDWIHNHVSHNKFKVNRAVGTALVDMYAKCGRIECADRIFHQMKEKDLLTWSVMISGWATHGCSDHAFHCFEEMIAKGFEPDAVVFLAILTACSHSGLVDRGLDFFNSMRVCYSIEPSVKHYTCMVDLFGRAGQLQEALSFIKSMPIDPDFVIWGALFCACRSHKNIEMAELASESLLQLEPKHPGSYIFLSNIYAGVGRWEDVERIRLAMKSKGIEKPPGWSYIEVEGKVHSFIAGDRAHKHAEEIYTKLEELMVGARAQGYMPDTEWVLHNIEEEEKEDALGSHSEKLALAFGLINTPHGSAIRIVKNLRVCGDCHSIMKYASIMSRREIILRDIKRFHGFKDGKCSCGDYW